MDEQNPRLRPYVLKPGEGWTYRFGLDFTVKSREAGPANGAAVLEYVTRQGEEPPRHTHRTEDEMFYVLAGEVAFHCGEETFEVATGGFIFLPRGIPHGYTLRSEGPVRLLVITSPVRAGASGGWGGFVADIELGQGELVAKPPAA
jgi:quercetin dioxygenase-like cupin family protein